MLTISEVLRDLVTDELRRAFVSDGHSSITVYVRSEAGGLIFDHPGGQLAFTDVGARRLIGPLVVAELARHGLLIGRL